MQTGIPLEVLVYDDASDDGTQQMVKAEFPTVRYFRNDQRTGYIVLRNRGFRDADSPYVFSIDDDAWFSDSRTVSRVVSEFENQHQTAAFALQYVEPNRTERQGYMPNLTDKSCVRNYIGCAHVIRTNVARQLAGYREYLIHQGEERDLCLRIIDAGYHIQYLTTPAIVHEPSSRRDHSQLAYLGLRNTFLFDVVNVPIPHVLLRLPADIVLLLKHRISLREFPRRAWHVIRGLAACTRFVLKRAPVSNRTYRTYRTLPAHGPIRPVSVPSKPIVTNRSGSTEAAVS